MLTSLGPRPAQHGPSGSAAGVPAALFRQSYEGRVETLIRVSRQAQIALFILAECARSPDALIQTVAVAEAAGTTKDNAAQIVNLLATKGLLRTRRGRNGGIALGKAPGSISMGDVLRITETDLMASAAGKAIEGEGNLSEVIQLALDGAMTFYLGILDKVTISDIATNVMQDCPGDQFVSIGLPCPFGSRAVSCGSGCLRLH